MGTCLCVEDNSSSSLSATRNDRVLPTVALDDSHDDHDVRSSLPLPLPSSPSGRRHPNETRNSTAPQQHPPLVQHHRGAEDGDNLMPCFAEHRTTTLMMRTQQQQQQEQDDPLHLQQEMVHRKGSSIAPTHERRPTGGGSGASILNPLLPPSSSCAAALPPPSLKRSSFAVPGPLDSSKLPHIPFTADGEEKVLEEGGKSHLLLDAQQQPIPLTNNVGLSTATADSNECSLNRNAAPPNPSFIGVVDSARSEATTGEMMLMSPELRRCGRPSVGVSTRGESSSGGGLSGGAGAALLPTSTTAQQQPHLFPQLSQRPSTPSNEASELRNGLVPTTARRLASEPLSDTTNTPLRPQPQPLLSSSTPTAAASPHHSNTRGAEEATAATVALVGVGSPHRYEARGGGPQPPTTPLKTSRKPHVTVTPTHSKSKPSTGGGGGTEHHHRNPPRPQQPPPQSALQDFQTTVAGSPTHPYYSPRHQQIRSSHTIPIQTLVAQMHHPGSTARIKWLFLDTESCEEEVRREWAVHRQIQGTVWYLKPAAAAAPPPAVVAARKPSSHSGSGCLELSTSAAAMVAADGGSGPFRNASQDNSPIVDQRTSIC